MPSLGVRSPWIELFKICRYILFNLFLGMTSEGGGAVAFPVMTLLLKIDPKVARDFSLMVQSVGKFLNKL